MWPPLSPARSAAGTARAGRAAQCTGTSTQSVSTPHTVRITSPLGRTGETTQVRIVVQVQRSADAAPTPIKVRFYVDNAIVGTVEAPPYAVPWIDENPFEQREIRVEAEDGAGLIARDSVTLPAFEISEQTEVGRILVEAGVYDAAGRAATRLDPKAFRLREDGEPQTLDVVARETYAMNVVLLVDNSQSMQRRMADVRRASERFALSLDKGDTVTVAPFHTELRTITGPTNDVATISEAIAAMKASGGTAILDSVYSAVKLLDGMPGRRIIVLVTDGFDENSTLKLDQVIERAQSARIAVYALAIGGVTGVSLNGETTLRQITSRTGGRVFFPWRDGELAAIARDVADDAHNRYLMTYTPSNQKKDGTWRAITVEVPEGYKVQARAGYRAPSPPPIRPTIEFHVTNDDQQYVALAATDFVVVEDGVQQKVDTFHEALDPVSIVLTLDASGSMVKAADTVRETAREFVRAVRKEDRLALVTFADEVRIGHVLSERSLAVDERDRQLRGEGRYRAVRRFMGFAAAAEEGSRPARHRAADRRTRREQSRHRAWERPHVRRSAHADARGRRDGVRGRPGSEARWRRARAPGRAVRRAGVFFGECRRTGCHICPDCREPSPALRRQL